MRLSAESTRGGTLTPTNTRATARSGAQTNGALTAFTRAGPTSDAIDDFAAELSVPREISMRTSVIGTMTMFRMMAIILIATALLAP